MARSLLPRSGYDLRPQVNTDALSKVYIAVCVIWTGLLIAGVVFLVLLRKQTFIRMRNLTLAASSVVMLHIYLILVQILYPRNGVYPCAFEYWIMSIYFPIGVALFQAQNVQLLDLSCLQRQLMLAPLKPSSTIPPPRRGLLGLLDRWRRMSMVSRTYAGIVVGIVLELIIALVIYLKSPRLHMLLGHNAQEAGYQCRHGAEWLPSALWQAIWTFLFGPYILFKIRNIHDIYRWKLQTSLAILFSLPGLPIVIVALYWKRFDAVNRVFPPPMWFAPGIMMMEFVTIFFPLMEAYRARYRRKITIPALEEWEKTRAAAAAAAASMSCDSLKHSSTLSQETTGRRDAYSMQALEKTLATDATDLLQFAATKEFTGENIVFLTQVRDWKRLWAQAGLAQADLSLDARRRMYHHGAEIFFSSVCMQTAHFPVNIEGRIYSGLERVFSLPSRAAVHKADVAPFADDITRFSGMSAAKEARSLPAPSAPIRTTPTDEEAGVARLATTTTTTNDLSIPADFNGAVFDRAEASVKYMVFTNTWVRYVDACASASQRGSIQSLHGSRSSSGFLSMRTRAAT
ncbi:MAG: hypothetical protein M1826_001398 [Phylliscum demangeonii]|nr:MAG: hypothetical protein M1826_001398 [Phylliscum demangeonii]